MNQSFADYVTHGWNLTRIQPGQKAPRHTGWNKRENAITLPKRAAVLSAAGLCHAYSGTCALDVDRWDDAAAWLSDRGIDLSALFRAEGAVQISSGQEGRGKLLFALPDPLPTKMFAEGAFELRCGTSSGRTAQDVLPPSPHPSGTTYQWVGDWRNLPPLPDALRALWLEAAGPTWDQVERLPTLAPKASDDELQSRLDELSKLVEKRDPDCSYEEWIKVGMALHHETEGSEVGFQLWAEWSSRSHGKYPGADAVRQHWLSFGESSTPVTAAFLRASDIATADEFDVVSHEEDIFAVSEKPPAKTRFRFLTLDELFKRPTPDWIIPAVLPRAALGTYWGQPQGGKTFLAVDTALSVALGQPWRGFPAEQGPVLYIAAEDDAGVQIRFRAGLAARGAQNAPVKVLPTAPVLTSPEQAKALQAAILAEARPSVIFFDTLAAVTPGSDENAAKDMSQLVHYCQQLSRLTRALVILIHHEGKSVGRGPRGWSGLHGAFDVEWLVAQEGQQRTMSVTKMKNAAAGASYNFRLSPAGESCTVEWR